MSKDLLVLQKNQNKLCYMRKREKFEGNILNVRGYIKSDD